MNRFTDGFEAARRQIAGGAWADLAEQVKQGEVEASIASANAECEQEEADRLRRKIGGLPVKHMQELPHVDGNPFIHNGRERYDYE